MTEERKKILKINNPRNHKIKRSIPIRLIYYWAKQNNLIPNISEIIYSKIIRQVNKSLIAKFLKVGTIEFPYRAGKLILLKSKPIVKIKNNSYVNNYGIDWDKTLSLWETDEEAKKSKLLIKKIVPFLYGIMYIKASFINSDFYKFYPNREFKNKVRNEINNGKLDGYKMK